MYRSLLIIIGFSLQLFAEGVAHDQQYYTKDIENTQLIYTEKNIDYARQAVDVEKDLHHKYEKYYQWKLDETLYVGLMSDYNQIANGYSTPYPNNRQINFIGGTTQIDYFTTTSWLNTLLYHESAHNYQSNVKASPISRGLHSTIGNGSFFIPFFTIPNIVESSFLLEGNAVLNESWHGNGGRLWSGRFKAETILQAQAGYITPERTYNEHLYFPYGEHHYIVGGFFQLYLANRYGVEKANHYFKEHSRYWYWPFFVNVPMQDTFGKDYETLIKEFSDDLVENSKEFKKAEGTMIAHSQFFSSLNRDEENIFFTINENGREEPELVNFDTLTHELSKEKKSYLSGKVIKKDDLFYTQASRETSAMRVYQGLFDDEAFIKEGSEGKVVQGYLKNDDCVYFDVSRSFDQAQLYIAGEFYAQANSSVIIDKEDNLYYFVQKQNRRTLYKNKKPLVTIHGYYGIVSDVDSEGGIYFVANSHLGSTLYRYFEGTIVRVSDADNIIEARLVDDDRLFLAAIDADEYYYVITNKTFSIEVPPYKHETLLDTIVVEENNHSKHHVIDLNETYSALGDMHFSGIDANFVDTSDNGLLYYAGVNFADPLVQNSATLYVNRGEDQITLAGLRYSNTQYIVNYSLNTYGIVANDTSRNLKRDFGLSALADLKYLKKGYYQGSLKTSYFLDYLEGREPLAGELSLKYAKAFGVSRYYDTLIAVSLFGGNEREDSFGGVAFNSQFDIYDESYFSLHAKYSQTDANTFIGGRGIKISSQLLAVDNDPSIISMPSLNQTGYLRYGVKAGSSIKQVFNYALHYFTFPISLRREVLSLGYNYYELDVYNNRQIDVNEANVALTAELLLMNKLPVDFTLNYYYNDLYENSTTESVHRYFFSLGLDF